MAELRDSTVAPAVQARSLDDLRTSGLLWLINRVVFHPRGFALGVVYVEGVAAGWTLDGDGRDPYRYGEDIDEQDLLAAVEHEFATLRQIKLRTPS